MIFNKPVFFVLAVCSKQIKAAATAIAAAAAAVELEEAKQELLRARRDIVRLTALSGDV